MYRVNTSKLYDYLGTRDLNRFKKTVASGNAILRWNNHRSIRNFLRLVPVASYREGVIGIIEGIWFIIKDTVIINKYERLEQDMIEEGLLFKIS